MVVAQQPLLRGLFDNLNGIEITTTSTVFKLLLSMLLGCLVGYQRKSRGQTAGVRTFSLIAMGATLAMILSIYVPQEYLGLKNGDPGRIAAQVVTGIGFLGAGAIIQMRGSVRGLTTAAGIWMVAAIGMAVGVGMYLVSVIATLLILFVLSQMERIEHRVSMGAEARVFRVKVGAVVTDIGPYRRILAENRVKLTHYYVDYDFESPATLLNLAVLVPENVDYISLFHKLRDVYPTQSISLSTLTNI